MELADSWINISKEWSEQPDWLVELRGLAQQEFAAIGWPTSKVERYKYTSFKKVVERQAYLQGGGAGVGPTTEQKQRLKGLIADPSVYRLVFIDGALYEPWSDYPKQQVQVLAPSDSKTFDWLKLKDVNMGAMEKDPLHLLRTAYFITGYTVKLAADAELGRPLNVVHLLGSSAPRPEGLASLMVQNRIELSRAAQAEVIETIVGSEGAQCFFNSFTSIHCGEQARLEFTRLADYPGGSVGCHGLAVECLDGVKVKLAEITLAGGMVRNDLQVTLRGCDSDLGSYGAYLVVGNGHVDNHTNISHKVGGSTSQQIYKGIVKDQGRAVFDGRVVIDPGANGTSASQMNKNLLLTTGAEVDTKPNLEIYADDVKATHGATIGRLSDDEVFYLRSRGISQDVAKNMLCQGFLEDVVYELSNQQVGILIDQFLEPGLLVLEGEL